MTYFKSGAYRDNSDHKLDYDGVLSPRALEVYARYMLKHAKQSDGHIRPSDNWQKGIELSSYQKSLLRHTFQAWGVWRGNTVLDDKGEEIDLQEALCAIIFNAQGMLHEMTKASGDTPKA